MYKIMLIQIKHIIYCSHQISEREKMWLEWDFEHVGYRPTSLGISEIVDVLSCCFWPYSVVGFKYKPILHTLVALLAKQLVLAKTLVRWRLQWHDTSIPSCGFHHAAVILMFNVKINLCSWSHSAWWYRVNRVSRNHWLQAGIVHKQRRITWDYADQSSYNRSD